MLEKEISILLENEDVEHFNRLNEPYIERNRCDFASRGIDYLAQVASPRYVLLPEQTQNEANNFYRSFNQIQQNNQPNEQTARQYMKLSTQISVTSADLALQSPSIMTNYLSFDEIRNKPAENPLDEIELHEQKNMPKSTYTTMTEIMSSIRNNTHDQKLFADNYINAPKISV